MHRTYTGFENSPARLHINVGDAGATDDVTATIRRLDGTDNLIWSDLETGRHYLVVYFNVYFYPIDLSC